METSGKPILYMKTIVGVVVGILLSVIDNFASGGEVSPIIVVALLMIAVAIYGVLWGWRGWIASFATWIWLPLLHVIKHMLNLHDTIHPNTIKSIILLALFTLVVSAVGLSIGAIIRQFYHREKENR